LPNQIADIIKDIPNYRLVSHNPVKYVTDYHVSYLDKLKINSQCKISVVANLLHISNPQLALEQANNIKRLPDWELNEAFKLIDYGFMPQIKNRVIEAAATKSLVLVLKDDWNVIENFYTPDVHFLYFDNMNALKDKINECLSNWEYCEKIINNMFTYYMENYTMELFYKRHLEKYDT
jgi:hypothetical protein